jgi:transposase
VLAGKASGAPKLADGPIEAIRMLRVARGGAVKAKTAAINRLRAMMVTAPDALRSTLQGLPTTQLVATCAKLRPDVTNRRQSRTAVDRDPRTSAGPRNTLAAKAI